MGEAVFPLSASPAELLIRSFAAVYLGITLGYYGIFYTGPIAWISASTILATGYCLNLTKIIKKAFANIRQKRKTIA